jgi:hypothetical protein
LNGAKISTPSKKMGRARVAKGVGVNSAGQPGKLAVFLNDSKDTMAVKRLATLAQKNPIPFGLKLRATLGNPSFQAGTSLPAKRNKAFLASLPENAKEARPIFLRHLEGQIFQLKVAGLTYPQSTSIQES